MVRPHQAHSAGVAAFAALLPRFLMGLLMEQNAAAIALVLTLGNVAVLARVALGIVYVRHGRSLPPVT